MTTPPQNVLDAILAPVVKITRRCDIYESDGTTLWYPNAPFTGGTVSVDATRAERRALDLTIANKNGDLDNTPSKLWYDKVVKTYRGVHMGNEVYEAPLGCFLIDKLDEDRFPKTVKLTGRDYSKKLMGHKYIRATLFTAGTTLEEVVRGIAASGGIEDTIIPITGVVLSQDYMIETGTSRWDAIKNITEPYGFEVFFNPLGSLVLRPYRDPFLSPTVFTFNTGNGGSVAGWKKSTSDSQLYNHIAVSGENSSTLPVYAEAVNTAPTSPTNVDRLGYRTYTYNSAVITTEQQAQDLANTYLKFFALEQYDLNLESVVIPWLEGGEIIEFNEPNGDPGDPTRFLLSSFSIPMELGVMSSNAKRVTYVG